MKRGLDLKDAASRQLAMRGDEKDDAPGIGLSPTPRRRQPTTKNLLPRVGGPTSDPRISIDGAIPWSRIQPSPA